MDNAVKKLLHDVLVSIERIETYIGKPKIFKSYADNLLLQQAVE